jgi:hypothetical protein
MSPAQPDPTFRAGGSPTPATLAGFDEPVDQWRTSVALTTILDGATDPNNFLLYGSAFGTEHDDLTKLIRNRAAREALGSSLIFRADGSTPGSTQGLGWGGQPGDYSSGFPTTIVAQDADDLLQSAPALSTSGLLPRSSRGRRPRRGSDWRVCWTSTTARRGGHLGSNVDDTEVAGAIALGENSGHIRVLGFWKRA